MASKKKIKKAIKSLDKQIRKHEGKIRDYNGKNYTLPEYWKKEIEARKKQKVEKERKLKK